MYWLSVIFIAWVGLLYWIYNRPFKVGFSCCTTDTMSEITTEEKKQELLKKYSLG